MAHDERERLQERIRELENYLQGLARGGAGRHAKPSEPSADRIDKEIDRTKRDIENLKRQLASAK
jgi:hypothetical protein